MSAWIALLAAGTLRDVSLTLLSLRRGQLCDDRSRCPAPRLQPGVFSSFGPDSAILKFGTNSPSPGFFLATFTNVCRRPRHRARSSYVTGKTRTEERRSRPSQRHLPRGPQVACASPGGREARGQGGAPKRHELGSFRQLLLMVTRRVRRRGKFCRGWK